MLTKPFIAGTRVRMTQEALIQHIDGRKHRTIGTVMGAARKYGNVRILRDGLSYAEVYHPSFWEEIPS